jgi:hypothetical protein
VHEHEVGHKGVRPRPRCSDARKSSWLGKGMQGNLTRGESSLTHCNSTLAKSPALFQVPTLLRGGNPAWQIPQLGTPCRAADIARKTREFTEHRHSQRARVAIIAAAAAQSTPAAVRSRLSGALRRPSRHSTTPAHSGSDLKRTDRLPAAAWPGGPSGAGPDSAGDTASFGSPDGGWDVKSRQHRG